MKIEKNLSLVNFRVLITCLLDNVRIFLGEVICSSLLGVKRLNYINQEGGSS